MYNEHFGLTRAPFRITPDTALFYAGSGRGDVLDALVYAVTSGEGIVKVVGEVGTGKTMLCRMLEERLPDNVQIAYLANPSLTPEDILHAVALELGLELAPGVPRLQVMHRLQQALLERHAQNRRVVALVEEAQSMPVDTLEEIRLLSNLETKNEKLLQIILFGQPELDDNLARPEIRQLRERITHSFQLKPLGVDEIKHYVAFRLRASGYRGRDAFTRDAYRVMSRASEGLTRRVNIIADKAMLAAFAEDTHDVSARHVRVAIQDSEFGAARRPSRGARPVVALAGAAAAVAVLAGAAGWYAGTRSAGEGAAPGAVATPAGSARDVAAAPAGADSGLAGADAAPVARAVTEAPPPAPTAQAPVRDTGTLASAVATPALAAVPDAARATTPAPAAAPAPESEPAVVQRGGRDTVAEASPPAASADAVVAPAAQPLPGGAAPEPDANPPEAASTLAAAAVAATASESPSAATASAATGQPAAAPPVAGPAEGAVRERAAAAPASAPAPAGAPPSIAPAPAPVAAKSLVDQRLEDTEAWLGQVNRQHYSIQLLATDAAQRDNLEAFLERRDRAGHLGQVFVYRTRISGRLWYGVLFGEYTSFTDAREALEALPRELRRHQPFIRNIRDVSALG